jgi:transposase
MPTVARRPAAQQERERLQTRRLRAAELFATGVRQAEVARQLGVSRQSVHLWHQRWRAAGPDALRSQGPTGPAPRLSDSQLRQVEQALLEGAGANGFAGELWTLDRIANLVCPTLREVVEQAELGIERARRTPHLAYSFPRRTGLSVS